LTQKYQSNDTVDQFSKLLVMSGSSWNPDNFSELCATALKSKDAILVEFCDKVTAMEWRLLLDHCNDKVNVNPLRF
jgi:hypothetical protein